MLTVAIPKRNKLQNIIVLTPKDGPASLVHAGSGTVFRVIFGFSRFLCFFIFFSKKVLTK